MYIGSSFRIPLKDGFSSNPDFDLLPATTLVTANNVNLDKGGISPRGGSDLVNSNVTIESVVASLSWTAQTAAEANTWNVVCYGNGLFVTVAQDGTHRVMTSPDGITWTAQTAAEANRWRSVCYGNGLYVAVASDGTHRVMTSPDGITWTVQTAAEDNDWYSVCYGNGLFVAVANSGTHRVMTSPDGITWTAQTVTTNSAFVCVCYGNGLYVAVANYGEARVITSPDGITWTAQTVVSSGWRSVCYGNGLYVAVAFNGVYQVMTSPDGITWTVRTVSGISSLMHICYGNGLYVAVAQAGTNRVMTSPDGITWTARTVAVANSLWSVCYGDNLFVAISYNGTYRVMILDTTILVALQSRIKGISQHIPESGNIIGTYCIDESANYIIDELGGRLIDESSDILVADASGNITKNYLTLLKSGLTLDQLYSFEQFYGKTYIANGEDVPQVYENQYDYTYDFGTPPKCTATLAGAGAGNVNAGTHSYKITFVSASGESTVGLASNEVTTTAGDGKVNLTLIPISANASCTKRKIYRTKAGGTTYYYLDELANNTATTYADNIADASISVVVPTNNEAFVPTDWQTGWPKYFLKHGRGNQQRLWAWGVDGYPNRLYASVNQEADFGDLVVTVVDVLGNRITAATEFGENLIVFSDNKSYILDDSSSTISDWGVHAATWEGGAAHQNLVVKTPTDVIVVSPEFNIFSIVTTQKYGDMEIGSISKPVYLQKFAEDFLDLQQISKFHSEYDKNIRAVKIFVVLKEETAPTACLVYFIDKTPDTGWVEHTFNLSHHCSAIIQVSENEWKIYTGGNDGKVYSLESDTLRDNGSIYESKIETTPLILDNPRNEKQFDKVWIVMKPKGTETLAVDIDIDNRALTTQYLIMTAPSTNLQNYFAFVGAVGQREEVKITSRDGKDYFLSSVLIDFKDLKSV